MHELEGDLFGVDRGAISPLAWILIGTWDWIGDSRLDAGLGAWFLVIGRQPKPTPSLTG
jgi:hypothetical protein